MVIFFFLKLVYDKLNEKVFLNDEMRKGKMHIIYFTTRSLETSRRHAYMGKIGSTRAKLKKIALFIY